MNTVVVSNQENRVTNIQSSKGNIATDVQSNQGNVVTDIQVEFNRSQVVYKEIARALVFTRKDKRRGLPQHAHQQTVLHARRPLAVVLKAIAR